MTTRSVRALAASVAHDVARARRRRELARAPEARSDPEGYLEVVRRTLTLGAFPSPQDSTPSPGAIIGWDAEARMKLMGDLACDVINRGVEGDFVEAGVYRGGMSLFLTAMLHALDEPNRQVWAVDSFSGCPQPDEIGDSRFANGPTWLDDARWGGRYACSLKQVRAHFAEFGLLNSGHIEFVVGLFHETLPDLPVDKIALLHVDADMYSSTAEAFEHLYPKLTDGGYVVCDDYGLPEARHAVQASRARLGIKGPIHIAATRWPIAYWRRQIRQGR